ncbi:MAG TPA: NAD(P)/FAD-dependent oxidoreductase [Thermomicrobiales bacterium]|nr:NAD(P)/FAD-dependent oxidoreductase [Thermomicrobiales bacterium]
MNGDTVKWGALGGVGALGVGAAVLAARGARARRPAETAADGPRVVILGAGFGGLTATETLLRALGDTPARLTLVDQNNYHLFTPLLYQIAACGVDPWDTAQPVRAILEGRGVAFRQGTVRGIDLAARRVALDDGALDYDYLVVALGSATNYFHEASAQQHALPLKTIPEALTIRERVVGACERAAVLPDGDERRRLLSFVVIGGGATGTELVSALADLLYHVLPPQYPGLDFGRVRVALIESEARPIAGMAQRLGRAALARLRDQGVDVLLNTKAKEVAPDHVATDTGQALPTATAIWTTGVTANAVAAGLDAPHGKGHTLTVDDCLRLPGHPEAYAVGDNAAYTTPDGGLAPMLAWAANQEGEAAARNIARAIRGEAPEPFRLRPLGSAVSLGRNHGAVQFGPLAFDGFAGWLAWRAIHLAKINTARSKLGVALDWTYAYTYRADTARLLPAMSDERRATSG